MRSHQRLTDRGVKTVRAGIRLIAFLMILLGPAASAQAFFDKVVEALVAALVARSTIDDAKGAAKEVIDDLDRRVKEDIDKAAKRLDDSTVKAGEELSRKLQEARVILDEMIDKTFGKAKEERRAFFQQLAEERRAVFESVDIRMAVFEGTSNSLLSRFDVIANNLLRNASMELDIAELVLRDVKLFDNPAFAKKENYGLYRFYGEGKAYKPTGIYDFGAVGKGFGREAGEAADSMEIQINGQRTAGLRQHVEREFARKFEVPVDALNGSFADIEPMPATISFQNKLVKTTQDITLFPKFPVEYHLTAEMADDSEVAVHFSSGPGEKFLDAEEAIVRRRIAETRKGNLADLAPDVDEAVRERLGKITGLMREHLPIGDEFRADLPPQTKTWNLRIIWRNGDGTTLRPGSLAGKGVQVIEHPQGSGRKRLILKVELPQ